MLCYPNRVKYVRVVELNHEASASRCVSQVNCKFAKMMRFRSKILAEAGRLAGQSRASTRR